MGTGERDAAKAMAAEIAGAHQKTLSTDKGYDTKGFVTEMRRIGVKPNVGQNTARLGASVIDVAPPVTRATSRRSMPAGASRRCLPGSIEWGGLRQFKLRGTEKVSAVFGLHVNAYVLIRLGNLLRLAAMEAACRTLTRGEANCMARSFHNCTQKDHPALRTALRAEISKKSAFAWGIRCFLRRFYRKLMSNIVVIQSRETDSIINHA